MFVVRGRCLDREGVPAAGASIYVVASPVSMPDTAMLSGEDGSFALALPVQGEYILGARSDAAGMAEKTVQATAEGEASILLTLGEAKL
ncbi:MAG: hypothetical protein H7039_02795 [Bryobacteraceae bacterium]|nr:hypothetical protein [Bryobacteraceae bacterium]